MQECVVHAVKSETIFKSSSRCSNASCQRASCRRSVQYRGGRIRRFRCPSPKVRIVSMQSPDISARTTQTGREPALRGGDATASHTDLEA